jgi:hypothetical protein
MTTSVKLPQLNRRVLIGAAAIAVLAPAPFLFRDTKGYVRGLLTSEFGAVARGEEAERFITDMARMLDDTGGFKRKVKTWAIVHFHEIAPFAATEREMEDLIISLFLKRTNAWRVWSKLDTDLIYGSLDPYKVGCANFLSALHAG